MKRRSLAFSRKKTTNKSEKDGAFVKITIKYQITSK
jgi:hypothetical protein